MKWILIIKLSWPGSAYQQVLAWFPTREECFAALEKAEVEFPPHTTENEWVVVKLCAPKGEVKIDGKEP